MYDYHFIIKELANEFGENFSVPIKMEIIKIDKNGNKSDETISCKIKFIDTARFMASSLSNPVYNLSEEIHKIMRKDCVSFREYKRVNGNVIIYNFLFCNEFYSKKSLMKN